jgi:hypothetical protein
MELEDRGEEEDWSNFYNFTNKGARWPDVRGVLTLQIKYRNVKKYFAFYNSSNKFLFVYSFLHIFKF